MGGAPPPPSSLPYGNDTIEVCVPLLPKVNSAGFWEDPASPSVFLTYSLPLLEFQMLVIFLTTHLFHFICKPIGVTYFASQMFAGIVLGIMGKVKGFQRTFFSTDFGAETLETTGLFGFSMFLFLMGVKMDLKMALRTSRRAIVIGIISLLSPIVVGLCVYEKFKEPNQSKSTSVERLMGITVESLTSCSVIACLLSELKILNSELGRLALSAAVVGDIGTLFLVYFISSSKRWAISPGFAVTHFCVMVFFVILIFFVFRPMMFRIIRATPDGRPVSEVYIVTIVMVAMACGIFTTKFNKSPLIGPFLVGLSVPDGPPIGSILVDKFECFVNGVFLAIYVTTATMRINPHKMFADPITLKFSLINIVFSFFAKLIPCFGATFWGMMPLRDSLAFALIMSSKGVVELSYFSTFRDIKYLTKQSFCIFTFGILVNAIIIPILVKFLYDPDSRKYATYQKRNLVHLKPDAELRILACVHRPEHVSALIDVLDITCPTKDSHNVVYALHLVELAGRDTPVFITHKKNENVVGRSFEHILAFRQYEENNGGLVTVEAFTAISPPKLMYEDICNTALTKQTSFILLPFHRKWAIDGTIEVESNAIRYLNCSVLDRAPCSVGILITRGVLDRRRKSLKGEAEEVSNRGPEAAKIVQSIANDYDLIIVGRRDGMNSAQTKGLSEWSEFPELGVIGDLLASPDLDSRVSILIVHQQHRVE
ncbi:cation/H(+) antiporter 4-like [Hibiscus syriacus]|uniref:cation/H(+) antiporter 4-like n=1 Tax=Hibiscus syriacus TaxID=106335 RepID=UPI001921AE1C|nr:cation/H(+) antiporter 4-like [Hibiscus syriacus]